MITLCHSLGWLVNYKKSELIPQLIFTFVGINYDLTTLRAFPTSENWSRLHQCLQQLLDNPSLPVIVWQSVIEEDNAQRNIPVYSSFTGTCEETIPTLWLVFWLTL